MSQPRERADRVDMGREGSATLFRFSSWRVCKRTVLGNPALLELSELASRARPVISGDAGLADFTDQVLEIGKRRDGKAATVVQQHPIFTENAEQNSLANTLERNSLSAPLGSEALVSG